MKIDIVYKLKTHTIMKTKNDLKFNDVYSEFVIDVSDYVNSRIFNKEDAEDITMKVFGRVLKHLPEYDPQRAKLNTWIYTITNRLIIDHFRINKPHVNVSELTDKNGKEMFQFESDINTDTITIVENNELREKIMQSFDNLKGLHKRVAEMYLLEGTKQDKIAQLLDIPIGTVKGTLSRAKEKLSVMLVSEGKEYCMV